MRSICKKVPLKNTLYFRKYKKDKFLTERYIILLLHYYYLLSEICLFYISQNTTYFLTGLFCIHFFCKYLSIYFNIIIFGDIEVWDFKIFKILKVKRALVPMCTKSLPTEPSFKYCQAEECNFICTQVIVPYEASNLCISGRISFMTCAKFKNVQCKCTQLSVILWSCGILISFKI
jgi:hypothetical protein